MCKKRKLGDGEHQPNTKRLKPEHLRLPVQSVSGSFKIASWNVNGIRSWLSKGGMSYVKRERPDVLCLQEVKIEESDIPEAATIKGYTSYWSSADRPGYSGVGMYCKVEPISVTEGIGVAKHNREGRVLTAEYAKFYIVNTYVPNSGRGLPRLGYRTKEWDGAMRRYLKRLDAKKPVIWAGDLNVAHEEIDLRNPTSNHKTAGFTDEEREQFTKTLNAGFIDSFRYLHPNKVAYSFWSHRYNSRAKNIGWRLDYFVISERFKSHLRNSVIREKVMGSDHCPVVLSLSV